MREESIPVKLGRSSGIPRPDDLQIARASLSTSSAETREQAIEGDGKNPSLGQPVLSSDDRGVQADPVTSTHLGVGGTDDEHVVVERTAIDEPDEITDAVRRHGMGVCGGSFFFCAKHLVHVSYLCLSRPLHF